MTMYFNQYHLVTNRQNLNLKKTYKSKPKREKNILFFHMSYKAKPRYPGRTKQTSISINVALT